MSLSTITMLVGALAACAGALYHFLIDGGM